MWLQEFLETKLVLQPICKHSPKLQIIFEFGAPWIFESLITVHPFELFTQVYDATSSKRIPFNFKNG